MKVAFLHTVGAVLDQFRSRFNEEFPDTDSFHVLNEGLLQSLLAGSDAARVFSLLSDQLQIVAATGADLIVVTCSSTSPGVDIARPSLEIPVLKIDDPMARSAVKAASRIGLLCTASSTLEASSALLRQHADVEGRAVDLDPVLVGDAYTALLSGDRSTHDRIVLGAAVELAQRVDLLVLAQASLAPMQSTIAAEVPVPVLASPDLLFGELRALLGRPR